MKSKFLILITLVIVSIGLFAGGGGGSSNSSKKDSGGGGGGTSNSIVLYRATIMMDWYDANKATSPSFDCGDRPYQSMYLYYDFSGSS
jgi:hypothetical protein